MSETTQVRTPIPVVIFTGFLGAGKTTIIQRFLHTLTRKERVLTIVNDLSPDNIDVFSFQQQQQEMDSSSGDREVATAAPPSVSALSGGCVCCNLLGDFVKELLDVAHGDRYTYIILECTGVADPTPLVATVSSLPALKGVVNLEAVITVVSGAALLRVTHSTDVGVGDALALEEADVMSSAQVRGANVVLINNWEGPLSCVPEPQQTLQLWVTSIKEFVGESNPSVRVLPTCAAQVPYDTMIYRKGLFQQDNTVMFFLRAYAAMGKQVGDFATEEGEEAAELEMLGVKHFTCQPTSFVSAPPCSVRRLRSAFASKEGRQLLKGVWRSKGFFMAYDDDNSGSTTAASSTVKQFRWQSVGRRFDFGEVLPPYVPLLSNGTSGDTVQYRIVFIGDFATAEKRKQAECFFASIVPSS